MKIIDEEPNFVPKKGLEAARKKLVAAYLRRALVTSDDSRSNHGLIKEAIRLLK